MKYVNQPVQKTDAMALVTGKPVYTDDLAPKDSLIVKVLRSPHANAWVDTIKTDTAKKEVIQKFADYAAEHVPTSGHMRGSKEYRTLLVKVLTRRAWDVVGGMKDEY